MATVTVVLLAVAVIVFAVLVVAGMLRDIDRLYGLSKAADLVGEDIESTTEVRHPLPNTDSRDRDIAHAGGFWPSGRGPWV